MQYQVIVLDLDGTLTNSKKEITEPTRQALIDIQKNGKTVVLASGQIGRAQRLNSSHPSSSRMPSSA